MTVATERLSPTSPDIEALRARRMALDIEIARVATEWSEAWYAYKPYCPWDAVNERVMATSAFAARSRELQLERDSLQC